MTVEELLAEIRAVIASVPEHLGPYGALEAITSVLDDYEQDLLDNDED